MATLDVAMSGTDDFELPARKKPKFQELPLSNAQHDAIDGMLHTFKKKGEFDALRKKAFQQYNESAQRGMFEASLRTFTSAEIDRDSMKYLKPDKRIAAPLLEGAAARSNVYKKTEADIDAYIDQFMANAERALREIRRKEVGDEAVEEELRKGSKSEAEYAAEAEQRRHDRAKKFVEDEKLRKRKETQDRKKKELELLKKKQEALQKETERLQREQKRRAERDAWKHAEKERERERIRQFNEEREKTKKEAEEREKALQEERERRQKERQEREQKRLEAEALEQLLREGQEMAEKARRPELERSESMEPPARLKHQRAPKDAHGKEAMRAQGLLPTSLTLKKGDKANDKTQANKGEKDAKEATPVIPTGPRRDRERERERERERPSRPRSPSPARSTHSNRRRESSIDGRPGRDRRESLYRDISAEREAWKARQRGQPDRNRDRDRDRERDRSRDRDRDRERERDRERDRDAAREAKKREDDRDEGEVVERTARSRSPRESRENNYRPAGARRADSRSPPRRGLRDRTRSRSPIRRRRDSRDRRRDRDRDRDRDRSRSPVGIDRYIPGSGRRAKEDDEEAPRRRKDDDEEAPRRRRDDEDEAPRRRPRDDDHLDSIIRDERNMPRRRDDDDDQPRRRPPREDGDERSQSRRPPREPREIDEDHLNSIIRDERTAPRRRGRYDDRERDRPRGSDIDRYIPGGGSSARVDDDRDRTRRRDRSRSRDRDRSRDRFRDRSRDRARDRSRDRDRDRDRERRRDDSRDRDRDRDRRASKPSVAPEGDGESK